MGRVDPICNPFVLQIGPTPSTNGSLSTPKPSQNLIFVCKISGTSDKKRANCPFFNNFPVPLNAWDKRGTRLGHGTKRDSQNRLHERAASSSTCVFRDFCVLFAGRLFQYLIRFICVYLRLKSFAEAGTWYKVSAD